MQRQFVSRIQGENNTRLIPGKPHSGEAAPTQLVVDLVATCFKRVAEADGMKAAMSVATHLLLRVQEI